MTASTPGKGPPPVPIDRLAAVILGQAGPETVDGFDLRGLGALVASLKSGAGGDTASETRLQARRLAATYLVIEDTARSAMDALQNAGLQPVLLKGLATGHYYPRADLRPTGDVDLLVQSRQLAHARSVLEAAGWQPVVGGRWAEDYIRREGYCWQGARPGEAVLELHYRLWGSVTPEYELAILEAAKASHPCPEDLVVIAASHAWRQSSPRRGADFLDVALVLSRESSLDLPKLLRRIDLSGQHLPVALCLRALGEALAPPAREWLDRRLVPRLRGAEVRLFRVTSQMDDDQISWTRIRLAMLLARRPSRIGWKAVWRRVWPHPAVIEQGQSDRPWWQRRLLHVVRRRG